MSERKRKAVAIPTPPAVDQWIHGQESGPSAKPPTKKMTWELPLELYKWLAKRAIDVDRSMLAIVRELLERYRVEVFNKANARVSGAEYELELGWVFVVPVRRGKRIAEGLCRQLLARVPTTPAFATTRPTNLAMIRILRALGFARVGKPYSRREEELVLFLRSRPRW